MNTCIVQGCELPRLQEDHGQNNVLGSCHLVDHKKVIQTYYEAMYSGKKRKDSRMKDRNNNPGNFKVTTALSIFNLLEIIQAHEQVSTIHVMEVDQRVQSMRLKYQLSRRYLDCLFSTVWCCGFIANLTKMYTHESHEDIVNFLFDSFQQSGNWPTRGYFDKACSFLQTLKNVVEPLLRLVFTKAGSTFNFEGMDEQAIFNDINISNPSTFQECLQEMVPTFSDYERKCISLYNITWQVDLFHFRGHNDAFCKTWCNPNVQREHDKQQKVKPFNTSAAEQVNAWLDKISHILRNLDQEQSDFYMYTFIDIRNGILSYRVLQSRLEVTNDILELEDGAEATIRDESMFLL